MQATFHHNSDLTDFPFEKEEMRVTFDLIGSDDRMDVDHGRVLLPINTEVRVLDANSLPADHRKLVTQSRWLD
jgi:hypothetical protein